MNPCPCGWLGAAAPGLPLHAGAGARATRARLSGPLLDRIDLHVDVAALPPQALLEASAGEPSARVRERCIAARARAIARQGKTNHALLPGEIDVHVPLDASGSAFLQRAAARLGWSARATHRVLKVARTVADLAGSAGIEVAHLAEAVQYRRPAA